MEAEMKIVTSIMLEGIYFYTLYVWEQGSTVYYTRFKKKVHCGKTSFYVIIPNDLKGSDMSEELKETVRTYGEFDARMFACYHPGKVGQLLVHTDKEGKWTHTTKMNETGGLDLVTVKAFS